MLCYLVFGVVVLCCVVFGVVCCVVFCVMLCVVGGSFLEVNLATWGVILATWGVILATWRVIFGVLEAPWGLLRPSWAVLGCWGRFKLNKYRQCAALWPILEPKREPR